MRKTKIVCTLGPATDDPEILKQMMLAGMNVARFNFSHQSIPEHKKRFDLVKKVRDELSLPIAILLDTKGPEIRLGMIKDSRAELKKGDKFTLTTRKLEGDSTIASVNFSDLPKDVDINTRILIDDGLIELSVISKTDEDIECRIINGGFISNNKGVNVPGVRLSMPYISDKDREDIIFGAEYGFDFIAASFTRTADDILAIRKILEEINCKRIRIIAKIENSEGVNNIDEILRVSDGIMVARGDMGVEIPFEHIPVLQKLLIKKAYNAGKQVITATQMLESMIKNPRPTRAEATDVANAIYDGTSAIMLSGETAAGMYPVEAVKTMAKIALCTEEDIDYPRRFKTREMDEAPNVVNAISHATCTTALDLNAAAIITVTKSGQTARMISKYRPQAPIIGCTCDEFVLRQLNMSWGVTPLLLCEKNNTDELFAHAVDQSEKAGLVKSGDLVVITAGVPLGVPGTTNLIKVHIVGDILVSGTGLTQKQVCGNLCVCKNEEEALKNFKRGDILVISETSNNIMHLLKDVSGIVTEVGGISSHAAIVGLSLDIPIIVGAENATKILKSGTVVTLDSSTGVVSSKSL